MYNMTAVIFIVSSYLRLFNAKGIQRTPTYSGFLCVADSVTLNRHREMINRLKVSRRANYDGAHL